MTGEETQPHGPGCVYTRDRENVRGYLGVLNDNRKLAYFTAYSILIPTIVMFAVVVIFGQLPKLLGAQKSQISIGGFETQFFFQSTSANKQEYLMIVHPQGWQDTGIEVDKGPA